jgi:predicted metal-dependent HD superfamily phosphohydrolase
LENFSTPFIEETKKYVVEYITDHFTNDICYHNIDHTLEVVDAVEMIGRACKISDQELEILKVAAWFHDTGYYLGCADHEKTSAEIARKYLLQHHADVEFIASVEALILSTKIPQNPQNLLEKIICDADLYHLSSVNFFEKSELLLQEFSFTDKNMTPEIWLAKSKEFIEAHNYHTKFGREKLFPQLKKNLKILNSKINSSKA